jgi:ABC-type branched-subunit amino acid transport system ATPase component
MSRNWGDDAYKEAEILLDRVGLGGRGGTPTGSMTYIDQKRLELARALASNPRLLLLDEWLAGLNPSELKIGIELIRELREDGRTIIMVEHVMDAIRSLCDRCVVMSSGIKIADGDVHDVLRQPEVIAPIWGRKMLEVRSLGLLRRAPRAGRRLDPREGGRDLRHPGRERSRQELAAESDRRDGACRDRRSHRDRRQDITRPKPHRVVEAGLALVPEGRGIFGDLTVAENLRSAPTGRRRAGEASRREQVLWLFPGSPNAATRSPAR